jgi:hypothetical protein
MRRCLAALLIASPLALVACGDDQPDALGDNPTKQECLDVTRTMLERLEVPDGVDPSDGLDDEERAKADAAFEEIAKDLGIDTADDADYPCSAATDDLTAAEVTELTEGIDPEILALLGAQAQQQFQQTGHAIN